MKNLNYQKGIARIIAVIVLAVILVGGGAYYFKQQQAKPASKPVVDATANWKTYSYKNISFKYPYNWAVIFDSEIAGQPNGFDLHAQDENAAGYQPDGFYLSTFNDRDSQIGNEAYVLNPERKFDKGSSYIQFTINANRFYAGCASSISEQQTLGICNQILSTFKFTDQNQITDTSAWKTYTISKNSYIDFNCSFKYPANLSVDNALGKVPNYNNQSNWGAVSLLITTESRYIFNVYFYDSIATLRGTSPDPEVQNENIKTLDEIYAKLTYKNIGTENIGGIEFNKYFQPKSSASIIYATENNGHIIAIYTQPLVKNSDGAISINTNLTLSGQATDKLDAINQQILSTFKFLK